MGALLYWSLVLLLTTVVEGVPLFGSVNDVYDSNYEYEYEDNLENEEVFSTKTPHFLSKPLELVVNEGNEVRLPCLVDRLEGFVLLWRKNERIISVGNQIIDKTESKIHIEESENGNTLVINNVDEKDEAHFSCAIAAHSRTEIDHNVRVIVPPVIKTFPSEPLILREGESAKFSCQILSGTPIPDLKWRKCEGGSFTTGEDEILNGVLEFESVSRDDSGCYICEADNGFSEAPVTSMVMLLVEYPPSVHIQKNDNSAKERTITCTVQSQPLAEITWLKDGNPMEEEITQNIMINKNTNMLTLLHLGADTLGNYTCQAQNKIGKGEAHTRISGHQLVNVADENHKASSLQEIENGEDGSSFVPEINGKTIQTRQEPGSIDYQKEDKQGMHNKDYTSSVGKVYFARIPSFYTFPDASNKDITEAEPLIKHAPKSVIEFLRLLRIYHNSVLTKGDVEEFNEFLFEKKQIPDTHLLRGTHAYYSNLRKGLQSADTIEMEKKREFPKNENIKTVNLDYNSNDGKDMLYEASDIKSLESESKFKDDIDKTSIHTFDQYEESSGETRLSPEEEKKEIEETFSDYIVDEIGSGDIESQWQLSEDKPEQLGETFSDYNVDDIGSGARDEKFDFNYIESQLQLNEDKPEQYYSGVRYLQENEIGDLEDEDIDDHAEEKKIPVFRGQHLLGTNLQDFDLEHEILKESIESAESEDDYGENLIKHTEKTESEDDIDKQSTDEDDEDDEAYLENDDENAKSNEDDLESKIQLHDATWYENKPEHYLSGDRYLQENQILNIEDGYEIDDLKKEKNIPVFRGQHQIQTILEDSDSGHVYNVDESLRLKGAVVHTEYVKPDESEDDFEFIMNEVKLESEFKDETDKQVFEPFNEEGSTETESLLGTNLADFDLEHEILKESIESAESEDDYEENLIEHTEKTESEDDIDKQSTDEDDEAHFENDDENAKSNENDLESKIQLHDATWYENEPEHYLSGDRYLQENQIEHDDEIDDLKKGKNIPLFRGQHQIQTRLEDSDSGHVYNVDESLRLKGAVVHTEYVKPDESEDEFELEEVMNEVKLESEFKDETDKQVFDSFNEEGSTETEPLEKETKIKEDEKGDEKQVQLYEETLSENKQDPSFSAIRYLWEDEVREITHEEDTVTSEIMLPVLRGQHMLKTEVGEFDVKHVEYIEEGAEEQIKSKEFEPSAESDESDESGASDKSEELDISDDIEAIKILNISQSLNVEKEAKNEFNIDIEKETMYPKEIKDIERSYFTNIPLKKNPKEGTHPYFISGVEESGIEHEHSQRDKTYTPLLFNEGSNIEDDVDLVTGEHHYKNDITEDATDMRIIEEKGIIPPRALFENINSEKVAQITPDIKKIIKKKDANRDGPHPFRFICMLRKCRE